MKHAIYADHGSGSAGQTAAEILQYLTSTARKQLRIWKQRRDSREILTRLAQYQLDDIGLTEAGRQIEFNKAFREV